MGRSKAAIVDILMERHGRTYCDELGIDIAKNMPSLLFRWLCAAILFSARISAQAAVEAARALHEAGLDTAQKLCDAGWQERVTILNRSGYARYDESTSRMLGDSAAFLIERYRGDLRRLRDRADGDPAKIHAFLQEFKGIGTVGADIFCREAQLPWPELYPFVDRRGLAAARGLGLAESTSALAKLVEQQAFSRLVAALVRSALVGDQDAIRQAAE